jgi:hypothetical protein
VRWAHFCVSFVETFCQELGAVRAVFDEPLDEGLAALRTQQETGRLEDLTAALVLAGFNEYNGQPCR